MKFYEIKIFLEAQLEIKARGIRALPLTGLILNIVQRVNTGPVLELYVQPKIQEIQSGHV